jgi:hypothetical protein
MADILDKIETLVKAAGAGANFRDALIQLHSLPCPYDTNGDSDCGQIMCPYCGKEGLIARTLRNNDGYLIYREKR